MTKANPGPTGLVCFGLTTVMLSCHNAGFFPSISSGIVAFGFFIGGLTQLFAGILEFVNGNIFGMTAFVSYGLFWMSFIASTILPKLGWTKPADSISMGTFMLVWLMLTGVLFVATLRQNLIIIIVFGTLFITFFFLMIAEFAELAICTKIAGYFGIICGLSAVYLGYAELFNIGYGRDLFPIFPMKQHEN